MSTTYVPRRAAKVKKSAHTYDDGGFDANVDCGQWLGRLHQYLELPVDPHSVKHSLDHPRVPFNATAAQTKMWAERITTALKVFRIESDGGFIVAWRDFLATCGGYDVGA